MTRSGGLIQELRVGFELLIPRTAVARVRTYSIVLHTGCELRREGTT